MKYDDRFNNVKNAHFRFVSSLPCVVFGIETGHFRILLRLYIAAVGRSTGCRVRHRRGWPLRPDRVDHGLDVSAVTWCLRDGAGRPGLPVPRSSQSFHGHASHRDLGLRRPDRCRSAALRPRRIDPDDVDRNADGVHPGRRQRPGVALSTRTGW